MFVLILIRVDVLSFEAFLSKNKETKTFQDLFTIIKNRTGL